MIACPINGVPGPESCTILAPSANRTMTGSDPPADDPSTGGAIRADVVLWLRHAGGLPLDGIFERRGGSAEAALRFLTPRLQAGVYEADLRIRVIRGDRVLTEHRHGFQFSVP
jgi:hypothetical protein